MPLLSRFYAVRLSLAVLFMVGSLSWMSGNAQAAGQLRGAQVHSLWSMVSAADMTRELDALQSANASTLRVDVGWATLESSKGRYDATYLAKLDALVAGAQARGMRPIVTLWQTPSWASGEDSWRVAPRNPSDYGDIARFVAARYGTQLAAIEVWNEADIHDNLIAADLAGTYTAMVKAAHTSVAAVAPGLPVLAGFVRPAFLQSLYAAGINGFHGGISIHPYADGADPANLAVDHSFLGAIQDLRAAQTAAGDRTSIWVTEFGWPVGTSRGANSQSQQADYTARAFGLVAALPYVAAASIYQLRDMGDNPADAEDNFGLLKRDFTPRPAFAAFAAALSGSAVPTSSSATTPAATGAARSVAAASASAAVPAPGGTSSSNSATSASKKAAAPRAASKRRPSYLKLRWQRKTLVAYGKTSAKKRLRMSLGLVCRRANGRTKSRRLGSVRTTRTGGYRRTLGKLTRSTGCLVVAKPVTFSARRSVRTIRARVARPSAL